ncbi:hypothetical protein [Paenibacillus daejeonensis]|uniref:hypothetical protein n=1 Tax=Paenibacillus daejeonensis TaxID=135193 RepID=UPI00037AEA31|nr:hypothetical protein [Paenibacillus daejeonensis]
MKLRFILVLCLLLLTACTNEEDTHGFIESSYGNVYVEEKREDKERYTIVVRYPNRHDDFKRVEIQVENKNIWNLIETNREYTMHFAKSADSVNRLYTVEPM